MTPLGGQIGVYRHARTCASTPIMSVKPLESICITSRQMRSQLTKVRPTDQQTNRVRYKVARSRLKIKNFDLGATTSETQGKTCKSVNQFNAFLNLAKFDIGLTLHDIQDQ